MFNEFQTLLEYLRRLEDRYIATACAFYAYEGLKEACTDNIVGKEEAKQNREALDRFGWFFNQAHEALRVYFFLELAKLFDIPTESLHINKIVNYASSNIKKLSKEEFLKFHQDRTFLEELFAQYEAMSIDDLKGIQNKVEQNKDVLQRLNDYRDKYLAHDDRNKPKIPITGEEVRTLFNLVKEILNLFALRLDFSSTVYDRLEKDCKDDARGMIGEMREFELERRRKVTEKYGLHNQSI